MREVIIYSRDQKPWLLHAVRDRLHPFKLFTNLMDFCNYLLKQSPEHFGGRIRCLVNLEKETGTWALADKPYCTYACMQQY